MFNLKQNMFNLVLMSAKSLKIFYAVISYDFKWRVFCIILQRICRDSYEIKHVLFKIKHLAEPIYLIPFKNYKEKTNLSMIILIKNFNMPNFT